MKIVFASSYFNHHQQAISDEFYRLIGKDYEYIETESITEERKKIGYGISELPSYVIPYKEFSSESGYKKILKKVEEADVLILGSAPEKFVKARMKKNLLTFRYSERIYKKGLKHRFSPRAIFNVWYNHTRFKNKKLYMLCASAFTALDFSLSGAYKGKTYKWGYFPEVKKYKSIKELIDKKEKNSILWAGRIIDWKHTEKAIEVAKRLKQEGYNFNLKIVGTGDKEQQMQVLAKNYGLENEVRFLGAMPPADVRKEMESAEIFLFTSNRREGWGAVLNESMNSGCAVVASHIIGSVPFLLKDGENGMIYQDGNIDDLYTKVKNLLDNPQKRKQMGINAYKTLAEQWNAENAMQRFLQLAENIANDGNGDLFDSGVCSKAQILKENWCEKI